MHLFIAVLGFSTDQNEISLFFHIIQLVKSLPFHLPGAGLRDEPLRTSAWEADSHWQSATLYV